MNEVNAIVTSGAGLVGSSVLLAGREAVGQQDAGFTSSPPLARRRCPACTGHGTIFHGTYEDTYLVQCPFCLGTGERSGRANTDYPHQKCK